MDDNETKPDRLHLFSREVLESMYRAQGARLSQVSGWHDELERKLQALAAERDEARAKIAGYEAGAEALDPSDAWGRELTPGQLWRKQLNGPAGQRMAFLQRVLENARTASACFEQDHVGRLGEAEQQREQLSIAVFGEATLDGTQQLHVAVRALRSVMVDGIAARQGVIEYAEVEPGATEDFPQERTVQEKTGEQLKAAGIDPQSICRYTWEGPSTDACDGGVHECRKVNPLHVDDHECDPDHCGQTLSHFEAEQMAEATQ